LPCLNLSHFRLNKGLKLKAQLYGMLTSHSKVPYYWSKSIKSMFWNLSTILSSFSSNKNSTELMVNLFLFVLVWPRSEDGWVLHCAHCLIIVNCHFYQVFSISFHWLKKDSDETWTLLRDGRTDDQVHYIIRQHFLRNKLLQRPGSLKLLFKISSIIHSNTQWIQMCVS
jgi:hypothetical protein